MRMIKQYFYKIPLQKKWMIINLLSSALLLALISFFLYYIIFSQVKEQFKHSAEQVFDHTSTLLENTLLDHQNAAQVLATDKRIVQFLNADLNIVEDKEYVTAASNYNYTRETYNTLQELYHLDTLTMYTSKGYYYDNFVKKELSLNELKESKWYQYVQSQKTFNLFYSPNTFENATSQDLQYIKVITDPYDYSKFGSALCITIPENIIYDIIKANNITGNGFDIIVDFNGNILFNTASEDAFPKNSHSMLHENLETKSDSTTVKLNGKKYYLQKATFKSLGLYLVSFMPYSDIYSSYYDFQFIFVFICLMGAIITILTSKQMSRMITERLSLLMYSLNQASTGVFSPIDDSKYQDDITLSIQNFNKILGNLEDLIKTQQQNSEQLKNYELTLLLEQINPHFLYNTMELINSIALKTDNREISEIVQYISNYYKLTLNNGQDITTLNHELQHVEYYLKIQNKRFDKHIALFIDIPDNLLNMRVAKIFLQPIIENSVYHGFLPKNNETDLDNEIIILAYEEDDFLYVEVTDNGIGIPPAKVKTLLTDTSNFALRNTDSRLKLIYGNECGLSVHSQYGEYTTVIFKLKNNL